MTRAYLESAASSSSSIGGSVMPSGWATVPDMVTSGLGWWGGTRGCGHAQRSSLLGRQSHEGDELVGGACHDVVDDDVVELVGGGQLLPCGAQPAGALLRSLGAPREEAQ